MTLLAWLANAIIVTPAVLGLIISSTVLLALRVLILPFAMLEARCQSFLRAARGAQ